MKLLVCRVAVPMLLLLSVWLPFQYQQRQQKARKVQREVAELAQSIEENKRWEAQQTEELKVLRQRIEAFDERPYEGKIAGLMQSLKTFEGSDAERRAMRREVEQLSTAVGVLRENRQSMLTTLAAMEQSLQATIAMREETEERLAAAMQRMK